MPPRELDARGWLCPIPVLRAQKILRDMKPGELLIVSVTDAQACRDFDLFCKETGASLLNLSEKDGVSLLTIQK